VQTLSRRPRLARLVPDFHTIVIDEAEDVSEVLVCYALRVYESPSTLQPNRVTS